MNILTSIPSKFLADQVAENLKESENNYGNQLFWAATIKLLAGHNLFSVSDSYNCSIDRVVYVMANSFQNQIADRLRKSAEQISHLDCPKVLLSIGAQHDNSEMFDFSDELKRASTLLLGQMDVTYLRGEYTHELLKHNGIEGEFIVNGCPSIFLNDIPAIEYQDERVMINMPRFIQLPALFEDLNAMAIDERVSLLAQNNIYAGFYGPHYELNCPKGIDFWRSLLENVDFTIGTRVHGSIMSLLCGVPTLCICWDSRTTELCKEMQIPHLIYDGQRFNGLDDLLTFARQNYNFDRGLFDTNLERMKVNLQKLDFLNLGDRKYGQADSQVPEVKMKRLLKIGGL